jgi:methionyl-tRNA formyltransferase
MRSTRIVFAGSPAFAVPSLAALLEESGAANWEIIAVLTQPDRPAGRGRQLKASPVKTIATGHGIEVLQPLTLRGDPEVVSQIAALAPDVIVVVAYGLILPPALLTLPRVGCLNVHASLLPRWRGASPIAAAIRAGDAETGVALMKLEEGLDTGPVFASARIPIGASETTSTLAASLAALGAGLLVRHLPAILRAELRPVPQPQAGVTYAPKISKQDAVIDWTQSAISLHRLVRAYQPWPVAETRLRGTQLRCWAAQALTQDDKLGTPGEIVALSPDGMDVQTGEGILRLTSVQPAGGKPMPASAFAQGRQVVGQLLGEVRGQ